MNEELKVVISAEIAKFAKAMKEAVEAITKLEEAMKDTDKQTDKTEKNVKKFGDKVKDTFKKVRESVKSLDEGLQPLGDTSKKILGGIGTAIAATSTALLGLSAATADYRQNQALLASAFESAGGSAEQATEVYNDLYRVLGDGDQATEAAQHLAKLTTEEKHLADYTRICQGVYAQFSGSLAIEGLTEAINHTVQLGEVQGTLADALEWSGISVDVFNDRLALCATEAEREKLVRETLNGLYSESAALYEQNNAEVLKHNEAQARLDATMGKLGEKIAPINAALTELAADVLEQLAPYIEEFADKYLPDIVEALGSVGQKVGEVLLWVSEHWDTISTIATVVLTICAALAVFSTVMGIVNTVMYACPLTWIIGLIVALIAAIALCIIYWDDIKNACSNAWDWICTKTKNAVDTVTDWFQNMKTAVTEKVDEMIERVKEYFENLKTKISEKVQSIQEDVTEKFEKIKNAIQQKLNQAKEIVNNIINSIQKFFDEGIEKIKNGVTDKFEKIKSSIQNKLNQALNVVQNLVNKLKNCMNFSWSLPKLKLPHLNVYGSFSLNPPSVPKFSISWYKLGGVFDKKTLFPYGGNIGGLGEDGAEAVVPLEKNTMWLDRIATMLAEKQGNTKPMYLMVDKKVLAQVSADGINDITRQTGRVPIMVM